MANTPYFGTENNVDEASADMSVDTIVHQDGLKTNVFGREVTVSATKRDTYGDTYGIFAYDHEDNELNQTFNSASITREEIVSDKHMYSQSGLLPGATFTVPDGSKILTYTNSMIWLGYTETIEFTVRYNGMSDPSFLLLAKPGGRWVTNFVIKPASGPAIAPTTGLYLPWIYAVVDGTKFDTHFMVQSINRSQQRDWHTAVISMTRTVPIADEDNPVSPLAPYLELWTSTDGIITPLNYEYMTDTGNNIEFYKITQTLELSSSASASLTESIEFYPSDEDADILETGY